MDQEILKKIFNMFDVKNKGSIKTNDFVKICLANDFERYDSRENLNQFSDVLDPNKTGLISSESFMSNISDIFINNYDELYDECFVEGEALHRTCNSMGDLAIKQLSDNNELFGLKKSQSYFFLEKKIDDEFEKGRKRINEIDKVCC